MKRQGRYLPFAAAIVLAIAPWTFHLADAASGDGKKPGALTAEEILKKCDKFHFDYSDVHMKLNTLVKDKDGKATDLEYEMWEKGEKRLIMFSEPADVSGMAVLVKDPNTIYVYEPEFNKVRRVAAHAKKQTMFGMDYSLDEMATKDLHLYYTPKILEEEEKQAVLWLEQKEGQDKAWPKLKVFVSKDEYWAAVKIEYCDENGKKKKTEVREKLKDYGGRKVHSVMTMTDHAKKHSTTLMPQAAEYDTGLPDEMFTKRYLIREE